MYFFSSQNESSSLFDTMHLSGTREQCHSEFYNGDSEQFHLYHVNLSEFRSEILKKGMQVNERLKIIDEDLKRILGTDVNYREAV